MVTACETGITLTNPSTAFAPVPWDSRCCLLACGSQSRWPQVPPGSCRLSQPPRWDVSPADRSCWEQPRPQLGFRDTEAHRLLKMIMIGNSDGGNGGTSNDILNKSDHYFNMKKPTVLGPYHSRLCFSGIPTFWQLCKPPVPDLSLISIKGQSA